MNKTKNISLKENFAISNIHVIHDVLLTKSNSKRNINTHSRNFFYYLDFQKNISRTYLPEHIFLLIPNMYTYSFPDNGIIRNNKLKLFLERTILKKESISVYFEYVQNNLTYIGFGKNNNVCEVFDSITEYDKTHNQYLDKVLMKSQAEHICTPIKKTKVLKF